MKIKGKVVQPPKALQIAIPRGDDAIIFSCDPVLDYSEFEKRCPEPTPPTENVKGKPPKPLFDDARYKKRMDKHSEHKMAWMVLQSLAATEGIEWETIDLNNPDTWSNYRDELGTAFTDMEIGLIISKVMDANIPNEDRQDEALKRFAQQQVEKVEPSPSPSDEQDSTKSGEPANDTK
jgi:hypothetical protein